MRANRLDMLIKRIHMESGPRTASTTKEKDTRLEHDKDE